MGVVLMRDLATFFATRALTSATAIVVFCYKLQYPLGRWDVW
jgi:hypothetical protein